MYIYFSQVPESPRMVSQALRIIADMYRVKFLADDSMVWVQVGNVSPMVWTLTYRSACTWYLTTPVAGCVRITNDRVRWAATVDASQSSPELEVELASLPGDAMSNFTLIVDHFDTDRDRPVSIVDNSTKQVFEDGLYMSPGGVHVIDAAHYKAAHRMFREHKDAVPSFIETPDSLSTYPDVTDYSRAHAIVNGTEALTHGMSKRNALIVRENLDAHRIELTHSYMTSLVEYTSGVVDRISRSIIAKLHEIVEERQSTGTYATVLIDDVDHPEMAEQD